MKQVELRLMTHPEMSTMQSCMVQVMEVVPGCQEKWAERLIWMGLMITWQ